MIGVNGRGAGRLAGKVAIVTGTGDGQGRVAALRFTSEGARVVGCDLNQAAGEETARLLTASGATYVGLSGIDLTDERNVEHLIATAEEHFGRLDLVYNNAAGARLGSALEMSRADFDFTIAGTLTIPWMVTKHAARALAASGGGAIVNVASISGFAGAGMVGNAPFLSAYGAAKAAVIRLTQLSAIELGPLDIRVNSVSPGIIDTPAVAPILGMGTDPRLLNWHLGHVLVPRPGTPEDVVNAGLFLLSDEASYITGQNLVVDGGWSVSGGLGPAHADVCDALKASFVAAATP